MGRRSGTSGSGSTRRGSSSPLSWRSRIPASSGSTRDGSRGQTSGRTAAERWRGFGRPLLIRITRPFAQIYIPGPPLLAVGCVLHVDVVYAPAGIGSSILYIFLYSQFAPAVFLCAARY